MLSDNCPTNIFAISDLPTFGFTRYSYSCKRKKFNATLNDTKAQDSSSTSTGRNGKGSRRLDDLSLDPTVPSSSTSTSPLYIAGSDPLLSSYIALLTERIPACWRFVDDASSSNAGVSTQNTTTATGPAKKPLTTTTASSSMIERDLWVFWVNDVPKPQDFGLDKLQEIQSGMLAWDSVFPETGSTSTSAVAAAASAGNFRQTTSSTHPLSSNSTLGGPAAGATTKEYELFIDAVQNVLDRGLASRGGLRLGKSYIFPALSEARDNKILPGGPNPEVLTVLSCNINIYLSTTNLVFRPVFEHSRIRMLKVDDIEMLKKNNKNIESDVEFEVILSPYGTKARIMARDLDEPEEDQVNECLSEWDYFFGTHGMIDSTPTTSNTTSTTSNKPSIPQTLIVRIDSGVNSSGGSIKLRYPTKRIFLPTVCKDSPSDVGGLDGIGSRSLGLVEDLGSKFSNWTWQERTLSAMTAPKIPSRPLQALIPENSPILAETRVTGNSRKSNAGWNLQQQQQQQQQQQHQLQQQQQQQQNQQLQQEIQQDLFEKQQLETERKRMMDPEMEEEEELDYWKYSDPSGYLTSIVLNSCANLDFKPTTTTTPILSQASIATTRRLSSSSDSGHMDALKTKEKAAKAEAAMARKQAKAALESEGWIRKRPVTNKFSLSPRIQDTVATTSSPAASQLDSQQWTPGVNGTSLSTESSSDFGLTPTTTLDIALPGQPKAEAIDTPPTTSTGPSGSSSSMDNNFGAINNLLGPTASTTSNTSGYAMPSDLPTDMMNDMMDDMGGPLGRLYGSGGNSGADLGWGDMGDMGDMGDIDDITNAEVDFSFFDERPRSSGRGGGSMSGLMDSMSSDLGSLGQSFSHNRGMSSVSLSDFANSFGTSSATTTQSNNNNLNLSSGSNFNPSNSNLGNSSSNLANQFATTTTASSSSMHNLLDDDSELDSSSLFMDMDVDFSSFSRPIHPPTSSSTATPAIATTSTAALVSSTAGPAPLTVSSDNKSSPITILSESGATPTGGSTLGSTPMQTVSTPSGQIKPEQLPDTLPGQMMGGNSTTLGGLGSSTVSNPSLLAEAGLLSAAMTLSESKGPHHHHHLQQQQQHRGYLVESIQSPVQSFIPSSFSPLRIVTDANVDESKYQVGGRYMYKPLYKRRQRSSSSVRTPRSIPGIRRTSTVPRTRRIGVIGGSFSYHPHYKPGAPDELRIVPRRRKSGMIKSGTTTTTTTTMTPFTTMNGFRDFGTGFQPLSSSSTLHLNLTSATTPGVLSSHLNNPLTTTGGLIGQHQSLIPITGTGIKVNFANLPNHKSTAVTPLFGARTVSQRADSSSESDSDSTSDTSNSDDSSSSSSSDDEETTTIGSSAMVYPLSMSSRPPRFGSIKYENGSKHHLGASTTRSLWTIQGLNSARFTAVGLYKTPLDDHFTGSLLAIEPALVKVPLSVSQLSSSSPLSLVSFSDPVDTVELQRRQRGQWGLSSVKSWSTSKLFHKEIEFDVPFTPNIATAAPSGLIDGTGLVINDQQSAGFGDSHNNNHNTNTRYSSTSFSEAVEAYLAAVRILCDQSAVGDYPFGGSNEASGSCGDISEGESLHIIHTRRRTMLQQLHGAIPTIPALNHDSFRHVIDLKTIVFELFDHIRGNSGDDDSSMVLPVPSGESGQDYHQHVPGHHHHQLRQVQGNVGSGNTGGSGTGTNDLVTTPPVVTMKGPFTLSQYITLSEPQQMPSKYGKYQVKKRKPAEPSLLRLLPPDILVGHNDEWLEASPTILRFWEKLNLEPYSARKNIQYFVVHPEGVDMEATVVKFWRELSVLYETCQLGQHQPGNLPEAGFKNGLASIPLLPPLNSTTTSGASGSSVLPESMVARQIRSYKAGCRKLGQALGAQSSTTLRNGPNHIVIYLVNPFSHSTGYFDLATCFTELKTQFRKGIQGSLLSSMEQQRDRLVLQLVPIQHILSPTAFGGYLRFGLRDIAFSVYAKCRIVLEREPCGKDVTRTSNAYGPSFVLAKKAQSTIQYFLKQKPNTLAPTKATLQVAFGYSLDQRWIVVVWVDQRGELLEHMVLENHSSTLSSSSSYNGQQQQQQQDQSFGSNRLEDLFSRIWTRTLSFQKRAGFSWTTVIAKLGLINRQELDIWSRLVTGQVDTFLVSLNLDDPLLRVYPHGSGISIRGGGFEHLNMGGSGGGLMTMMTPTVNMSSSTPNFDGRSSMTPMSGTTAAHGMLNHHLHHPHHQATTGLGIGLGGNVVIPGYAAADGSTVGGISTITPGAGSGSFGSSSTTLGTGGSSGALMATVVGGNGSSGGHEMLENSAGQVYAMVLNHRMPLTSRHLVEKTVLGSGTTTSTSNNTNNNTNTTNTGMDVDMGSVDAFGNQEPSSNNKDNKDDNNNGSNSTNNNSKLDFKEAVIESQTLLPLGTGYLIQVPINSNTAIREKHGMESLAIEIHLMHMEHSSGGVSAGGMEGFGDYRQNVSANQPNHAMTMPTAHLLNPLAAAAAAAAAASGSSSSTVGSISFSGSPSSSSSTGSPSVTAGIGSGANTSGGSGTNATSATTGTTPSALSSTINKTLREILKQYHSISFLTLALAQTNNCLPVHFVLLERMIRVLLLVPPRPTRVSDLAAAMAAAAATTATGTAETVTTTMSGDGTPVGVTGGQLHQQHQQQQQQQMPQQLHQQQQRFQVYHGSSDQMEQQQQDYQQQFQQLQQLQQQQQVFSNQK